jgi:lipopolysaccharide heptosyltransferase II
MFKKILIINPFGIGDVLFTTPIIHTLKGTYPDLRLGYLCNQRASQILENNPYIDDIFIYERDEFELRRKKSIFSWLKNYFAFLNQIREKHFNLALDLSLNAQYGFFSWYAGIKSRIGYDFKGRGRFLTQKIKLTGYFGKHIIEYYADLLKYLGIELKYRKPELYLKKNDIERVEDILKENNIGNQDLLVGIVPGAGHSWGREAYFKHWPPEYFAQVADKLVENYQAKIIILGDFSEKVLAESVVKNMHCEAIDFSGRTTIGELAALLNKMKIVITNDGGPLHMAVALGVKTVSIFGPVDELVYGPYPPSDRDIVVSNQDVTCRPCYKNFRFTGCISNRRCIEDISTEEVYSAARSLI